MVPCHHVATHPRVSDGGNVRQESACRLTESAVSDNQQGVVLSFVGWA
jgi:hypothetical protein